jgi:ElaB/YqjD/DUF883 family membrane-anchored ribosome-binding protein
MKNRIEDVVSAVEPELDRLKEQAELVAAAARERLAEGRNKVRQYIVDEPARALGIAFGVGVLVGWLIKRR